MSTILDVERVEGINSALVQKAVWLLIEAGMSKDSLRQISYELQTEHCINCKRHWQHRDSPIESLPTWRYQFPDGRGKRRRDKGTYPVAPADWPAAPLREAVYSYLEGYVENNTPEVPWRATQSCAQCVIPIADAMGRYIVTLPKNLLNAFCRMLSITIKTEAGLQKKRDNLLTWKNGGEYTRYVAIVNSVLQHLTPQGNARAIKSLIEASHTLGLL